MNYADEYCKNVIKRVEEFRKKVVKAKLSDTDLLDKIDLLLLQKYRKLEEIINDEKS